MVTPYSLVEQDIKILYSESKIITKSVSLNQFKSVDFKGKKITALEILSERYKCNTYTDLVITLLNYIISVSDSRYDSWYDRVHKHNKENGLIVTKNKDAAILYGVQPKELSSKGHYVNQSSNYNSLLAWCMEVCGEFSIDTNKIVIHYRNLGLNQLKNNIHYSDRGILD
jgi:hypothetical protein